MLSLLFILFHVIRVAALTHVGTACALLRPRWLKPAKTRSVTRVRERPVTAKGDVSDACRAVSSLSQEARVPTVHSAEESAPLTTGITTSPQSKQEVKKNIQFPKTICMSSQNIAFCGGGRGGYFFLHAHVLHECVVCSDGIRRVSLR